MSECRHGLDERWCASCKAPLRPSTASAHDISSPFSARFGGRCVGCDDRIVAGQRICMVDGFATHAGCVPA